MRGKAAVVLFIIVFLLIAAVIGTFLGEQSDNRLPSAAETAGPDAYGDVVIPPEQETPAPTIAPAPAPTLPVVVLSPAPSQTPKPAPTPTPAPTVFVPTPAPTQATYGASIGSGSFSSETGVGLNVQADWSAKTISSTQVEITVSVSINSYSLHVVAVPNSINVMLDGQPVSLNAPAVEYDGTTLRNTPMASHTFTVNLAEGETGSFGLAVEWHFGGTYKDTELPAIECGGDINLSR